ncbi:MAG TPA: hypothetical protein DCL54_06055 [Alphaproteobacteria bacterium]|nr:hypothetical protein [Alphaproteobacteria bacterium]HAJ46127.1 hypothetical protein [Alphaproteobacteria bacterium]
MPKGQVTPSHLGPPPPRYGDWLGYLFDRPVTERAWYLERYVPFQAPPEELADLVIHTFKAARQDLARFSDDQIAQGLNHIVNGSCGNIVHALTTKPLPKERRADVVMAIADLYRGCFDPRCAPVLGYNDQTGGNGLNATCYMFWDVSPFAAASPGPLLDVLQSALTLSNPACQESALHGLGHHVQTGAQSERAAAIIEAYLRKGAHSPELAHYARLAQSGTII